MQKLAREKPLLASENPLRTKRLEKLKLRLVGRTLDELVTELSLGERRRLAVVGRMGTGKTLLLERIEDALLGRELSVQRVNLKAVSLQELVLKLRLTKADDFLLLDEASSFSPVQLGILLRAFAARSRVLLSCHERPPSGFHLLYRTSSSAELLRELLSELGVNFGLEDCEAFMSLAKGNTREALLRVYDLLAGRPEDFPLGL